MTRERSEERVLVESWEGLTREARQKILAILEDPTSHATGEAERGAPRPQEITLTALELEFLHHQCQLAREVIEQLPMAVVITDEQWRIKRWMARPASAFGVVLSSEGQVDLRTYFLPESASLWEEWSALEAGAPTQEAETCCVRSNGTQLPVHVCVKRLVERVDGELCWLVLIEDTSEHHRLEEEVRQAQKLEALAMLTGGMTHDLNNLLTVILGHLELAEAELSGSHPVHQDLDGIRGAVERASALTIKLLAFARAQVFELQIVDIIETITQARPLLLRTLSENIRLVLRLDPGTHLVRVDPVQLEQLLINLVVNARDAIGEQPGQVVVATEPRLIHSPRRAVGEEKGIPPGQYLVLSVIDNGHGISPEDMERIFEPFFTTKAEGHGTGLGLSTCVRIARQNDGYMRCESRLGVGTIFELWLPIATSARVSEAVSTSRELLTTFAGSSVLVVEDDRALRQTIRRSLEQHGYEVYEARHGKDALAVLARLRTPPSLILTDVVMPDMGGVALAEQLIERDSPIPILFMSGYSDEVAAAHRLSTHNNFLAKPFTPKRLLLYVQEILLQAPS